MSDSEQKFLQVKAFDSDWKEIGRFETSIVTPTIPGHDTKYVTEGSPDKILDLFETIGQWIRDTALNGDDAQIQICVYNSRKEAL